MGTSLSGLTPATTFDGLLKTSDNDALDATLKTIGTGDGTDSVLQLSDSALQVNGATFIESDLVDSNIFQIGPSGAANKFRIYNSADINNPNWYIGGTNPDSRISFGSTMILRANGNNIMSLTTSEARIGGGSGARLAVKGSGATSATTSLLVQNSAGSDLLKVQDDGDINMLPNLKTLTIGNRANNLGGQISISPNNQSAIAWQGSNGTLVISGRGKGIFLGDTAATPTARLHVKGSGNTNTTTSLLVQNSDTSTSLTYDDSGELFLTGSKTQITLQRDGGNGGVIGNGNGRTYFGNSSALVYLGGKIGINQQTPTAQLQVKGSGATSATTALLVQNSAGTDLFDITDNGEVEVKSGDFRMPSYKSIYGGGSSTYAITLEGTTAMNFKSWAKDFNFNTQNGTIATLKNDGKFGLGETAPSARLQVKGSGNDATTTALLVQNSDGNTLLKADDGNNVYAINNKYQLLDSKFVSLGNNNFFGTSVGTAKVQIKGSGATSATTALLVENSAGTDLLKVLDDGQLEIKSNSGSVSTTSGTSIFSYTSGGGGVLDVNPSNGNSVKFRARGDNDIFLIQTNPAGDNVGIGASSPDSTAKLQVDSTTQGFLPPRMTTTERDAITNPAAGLMVYNTTTNKAQCYNGTAWQDLF